MIKSIELWKDEHCRGHWVWSDGRRLRAGHRVEMKLGNKYHPGQARYYKKDSTWGIAWDQRAPSGDTIVFLLCDSLEVRVPPAGRTPKANQVKLRLEHRAPLRVAIEGRATPNLKELFPG